MPKLATLARKKSIRQVEKVQMEPIKNIGKIPMENFQNFQSTPTHPLNNVGGYNFGGYMPAKETPYSTEHSLNGTAEASGQIESTGITNSVDDHQAIARQESNVEHRGDTSPGFMRVKILQKVSFKNVIDNHFHHSITKVDDIMI